MKIALILSTALVTTIGNNEKSLVRQEQYTSGITDIIDRFKDVKNLDLYISDNTIEDLNQLSSQLKKLLEKFTSEKIFFKLDNDYGRINKGCGLIAQWKNILPFVINNYKNIIHYEPRQILKSSEFFDRILNEPDNIFKEDVAIAFKYRIFPFRYHHFQTGFFSCDTKILLNFVKTLDLHGMVQNKQSIERLIYLYFRNNQIQYKTVKKLGVLWDSGNGYISF